MIPLTYKIVLGDTQTDKYDTRAFSFSLGGYFASLTKADITWRLSNEEVSFLVFQQSQQRNANINALQAMLNGNDLDDEKRAFSIN